MNGSKSVASTSSCTGGSSRRSRVGRRRARSGVPAARGQAGAARSLGGRHRPRTAGERAFLGEARAAANEVARRRARRRATLAGFALLAAAASVLAAFALVLRDRAQDDARLATARQLAASAQANLAVDPERSILLAIQAAETTQRHDGTILVEAEQALHDGLAASRVLSAVDGVGRKTGIGHAVSLAPDASRCRNRPHRRDAEHPRRADGRDACAAHGARG